MKWRPERIADAAFFLHKVEIGAQRVTFVHADRSAIRGAGFLDGRTRFWNKSVVEAPFPHISATDPTDAGPDRFIFHIGFCGSTILTRLLDQPGHTLILREPQSLTDIAAYQSALDQAGQRDDRVSEALGTARRLLHRRWAPDEVIVIKPSNWVNNLLPALVADPAAIRPLFVIIDPRAFLHAVLRGGADRIAFAARAAVHFSNSSAAEAQWVAAALARPVDQLERLLTLAALLHRFQTDLLATALRNGGWGAAHCLSLVEMRADLPAALAKAAKALAIPTPAAATVSQWHSRHAKQPEILFSVSAEVAATRIMEGEHGTRLDRILGWIDDALPPAPTKTNGLASLAQPAGDR